MPKYTFTDSCTPDSDTKPSHADSPAFHRHIHTQVHTHTSYHVTYPTSTYKHSLTGGHTPSQTHWSLYCYGHTCACSQPNTLMHTRGHKCTLPPPKHATTHMQVHTGICSPACTLAFPFHTHRDTHTPTILHVLTLTHKYRGSSSKHTPSHHLTPTALRH